MVNDCLANFFSALARPQDPGPELKKMLSECPGGEILEKDCLRMNEYLSPISHKCKNWGEANLMHDHA